MKTFFFEAFDEEREALLAFGCDKLDHDMSWKTIQEYFADGVPDLPPTDIISVRTQSIIPLKWAPHLKAILTRSTGFDHLVRYSVAVQ